MTGCRHNAKNTLVKNYLYLAEQLGAEVHPLTTVDRVTPLPDGGGYEVTVTTTGKWFAAGRRTLTAEQVVFAAGALGTQQLLHKLQATGRCRRCPPRLGELTRTNSESILGAMARRRGSTTTRGASRSPPPSTPTTTPTSSRCRYGQGSNAMGAAEDRADRRRRPRPALVQAARACGAQQPS